MKKDKYASFDETGGDSSKETIGNFENELRVVECSDFIATEQIMKEDNSNGVTDVDDAHVISFGERFTPIARFSPYMIFLNACLEIKDYLQKCSCSIGYRHRRP